MTHQTLCGRTAHPSCAAYNVAKTLGQIVVFWGFFLFVLPTVIYRIEEVMGLVGYRFASPYWKAVGLVLFALMSMLGFTSGMMMAIKGNGTPLPVDCPRALVIAGPYRYVRNPMALAGTMQGVAVGLYLGSPLVVAYAVAGMFGWNYLVRPWEERDLERRFGESYRRYRRAVRCWTPHCRAYDPTALNDK